MIEPIRSDRNVVWRPGRVFIPAMSMNGLTTVAIDEAGCTSFAAGEALAGVHTGAPITQEISTFGFVGVLMAAADDELNHYMLLPGDLDLHRRIDVRVHWTSGSSTTADTIDWIVRYLGIVPNTTTMASPTAALDTTIAQDTVAGAHIWQTTEWGSIDPDTFGEDVEAIIWEVELDAFAAGLTEDKFLLGLEMSYTPKRLWGPDGMAHDAKRPTFMLGKTYAN